MKMGNISIYCVFILIFCYTIRIDGQIQCYGVNGNTVGLSPNGALNTAVASSSFCPNTPNTGCIWISDTMVTTSPFNMTGVSDLTFTIDYELDRQYDSNDKVNIFYNCGDNDILGITINLDNQIATQHVPYLNVGFYLDSSCNGNSNIIIKIQPVNDPTISSETIYFNFENVCVGSHTSNPISMTGPTTAPTERPTNTPTIGKIQCFGVNGNLVGVSWPGQLSTAPASTSYCPNHPNTGCIYIRDDAN